MPVGLINTLTKSEILDMLRFLVGDVADVSARATYAHGLAGIDDSVAASIGFANGAVGTLNSASLYPKISVHG